MSVCPSCGNTFRCDLSLGQPRCWCFDRPQVMGLDSTSAGCLCPDCLEQRITDRLAGLINPDPPNESLQLPTEPDQNAQANEQPAPRSRNNQPEQH